MQRAFVSRSMGPVSVTVQPGGFAHIQLCSEPVNVMDMTMWEGLVAALEECEASSDVRGVIFSSGVKRDVFTAGNSLKELHAPSTTRERYFRFWHLSQVPPDSCRTQLLQIGNMSNMAFHCRAEGYGE